MENTLVSSNVLSAKRFDGDIVITDPYYLNDVDSSESEELRKSYWSKTFTSKSGTYLCDKTYYGDWSCTTFNSDNMDEIFGEFCADAGEVCVVLFDEVKEFNPYFEDWVNKHKWCVTTIKDFHGDISFILERHVGVWDDEKYKDTEWYGLYWENYALIVKGVGNINFETHQTGL